MDFSKALEKKNDLLLWLNNRIPLTKPKGYSTINVPKGYGLEVHKRILEVIEPNHPENPWRGAFVKHRNYLYVNMCLALGLRLGEINNISLHDVVRTGNPPFIKIVRNPDNPEDPRIIEPNVKTMPRSLVIERGWFHLLANYIDVHRRKIPATRLTPFLFVSRTGQPISLKAAGSIIVGLRRVEGIPNNMSQHTIRHAWNERFSEICDERGVDPEREAFARREYMGWSPSSDMPARYNRRHLKRKADAYSLEMQNKLIRK